ncbi:MAG: 30S ribosomal protein S4 [Fibrobacterota bacterium]
MSNAASPKCKLCRREGVKLMLKGDRCFLDKCAIESRNYAPGQHGANARRKKLGGGSYAEQLREKQKIKRTYGMQEGQFRNLFQKATRLKGMTGENFLRLLELRLDNIAFRMGFAHSRRAARQLVAHGHFLVNGRRVNIPSYTLKAGDRVNVSEQSQKLVAIHASLQSSRRGGGVEWLNVDKVKLAGSVVSIPSRDQIPTPVNEQLVVELYSK